MNLKIILERLSTCFLKLESGFEYGPQGRLLLRNIENLWFHHCVTTSRYNVFLSKSDKFAKTLQNLKDTNVDALPFGLAAFESSKMIWNHSLLNLGSKGIPHKVAKVTTFSDGSSTKDLFHKKQRERKAWWQKLAQQPSRFTLSEAKKGKNIVIDIEAQFSFGNVIVETITYQRDVRKLFFQDRTCKDDTNDLRMVEHIASLDWGCLALLCDSYKETDSSVELQMQPKISPYKAVCKVNVEADEIDSIKEDLNQLTLYINNLLRTKGLSTILMNDKEIHENFHVPFVIEVDKTSLKNGIVMVTSQITTLAESVHVTQLVNHIALHCT